jgi:ribosomal protein L9
MAAVKLLLKESIKNVGKVGDIVDVSPGYARN